MAFRELARRRSGNDEILLLWQPANDRVDLCVLDLDSGLGVQIELAPERALDAFHHPYIYVTRREDSYLAPETAGARG
jgi:hypothetical protein